MLDEALINRAAPPGSLPYFALLYAPTTQRAALTALLILAMEIHESAISANHDVAHTRLGWWRGEVDRMVNGTAQHPAARVLQSEAAVPHAAWSQLHEVLSGADMDLARMTYHSMDELAAYCARSSGTIFELAALLTAAPTAADTALRSAVNRMGGALRQIEILRDVRQDCRAGRLYLPLEILDRHGVGLSELQQAQFSAATQSALREYCSRVLQRLNDAAAGLTRASHPALRPLLVMAALHKRLLQRMAGQLGNLARERIELGPVEKPWVAWRAAMRANRAVRTTTRSI